MTLNDVREVFFDIILAVKGILLFFCLIRSFIGPKTADRLVAVNMVGTNTIGIIAVLACRLQAGYLADIGLIYAMVSFLAIVLLTKVYMGAYLEKKLKQKDESEAKMR